MEDPETLAASDEEENESKLSLGLAIVQDGLTKLAHEVNRAEARIKQAETKRQDAEERATKWEKLYRDLKNSQAANQQEDDADSDSAEEDERKPAASTRAKRKGNVNGSKSRKKRKRNGPHEGDQEYSSSEESAGIESDGESAEHFNALDEATKEWISSIGLENEYGNRDEALDRIVSGTYMKPPSFERVFLLADFLFPVEEGEETYHGHLFQRESRPGIKVRQELRRIKTKTPDDPMVCWHQKGKQWIPPTAGALAAMVRLIVGL